MGQFIVRGIPQSVLQDSWWLDTPENPPSPRQGGYSRNRRRGIGALAVLVALADVLFLDHAPGISLAVFALAVAAAVWALSERCRRSLGPALLLLLSLLPVIEYVQALSVAFLLAGSLAALCWALSDGPGSVGAAMRRLLGLFPTLTLFQVINAARNIRMEDRAGVRVLQAWAFPVGGGLVLAGLMVAANPVLSDWVDNLWRFDLRLDRVLFWLGAAMMIWPILAVALEPGLLAPKAGPRRAAGYVPLGLNAQSVANALILFNLLLAVQTGMDAVFLWGGADLPDGMSHAEYAHRGAYTLLATALLAGAFALAARPYLDERQGLTGWMMLWLGQNVLLVISSLMRLSLYVQAYGLTYLRVHAAIWMGLVALGLCLIGWQIIQGKSNRWLLLRVAALGVGVLYACCFVNFAALIARENLAHPTRYDAYYVCQLGEMAAAEIAQAPRAAGCSPSAPHIGSWREWGFRSDRVIRNLDAQWQPEVGHEDTRRG